ncbi:MAG TPA: type II secretion system protein, partial [Planctomycetaceae bacterium]|nr:type II secretion system protein [Planctomycetaceae bacterium]
HHPSPITHHASRPAFTLIEMLIVVTIIGILAGLLLVGIQAARSAARRAAIRMDIQQLQDALERYKADVGEYPPDLSLLNHPNATVQLAAVQVVNRHLRKRWPRFQGGWARVATLLSVPPPQGYGLDTTQLDQASSLAFWLCGLPSRPGDNKPAGFHQDALNPFRPGGPRSQPYFEVNLARFKLADGSRLRCYYYPPNVKEAPYVYFRAQKAPNGDDSYAFFERDPGAPSQMVVAVRSWKSVDPDVGIAVPYRDPTTGWSADGKYQILSAGLDGVFGVRPDPPAPAAQPVSPPPPEPSYPYPIVTSGMNFVDGDYDNLTSFARNTLESGLD